MRPNILIAKQSLRRDKLCLHIHVPGIRIPGQLPIEMETAEELHAYIDPETCTADAR